MQPKPLGAFFQSNDALAHLQEHASRLIRLQRAYEEFAPAQLARSSWVANFKAGVIVVHAVNGAVATKLNQLTPRFIDEFLNRGVDLTGIEVRLQVTPLHTAAAQYAPRALSAGARQALARLEDTLPAGSALRRIVAGFKSSGGG
jgi:hypothetical protein